MFANLGDAMIDVLLEVPLLQSSNIMVELIKGINVEFCGLADVGHIETNPLKMKPVLFGGRLGRIRCQNDVVIPDAIGLLKFAHKQVEEFRLRIIIESRFAAYVDADAIAAEPIITVSVRS